MEECHSNLCFTKAYISESIAGGLDIIMRACGGHGFSHYSGLPNLCQEFAAHPIHEGENTVLYLQVSRYILKNFKKVTKNKDTKLNKSVRYLENYEHNKNYKAAPLSTGTDIWSLKELESIFAHLVCYNVSVVLNKQ